MRNVRPLLLVASLLLTASCALLGSAYRPPRAPRSEAEKVKFPWGTPKEVVVLSGAWLRAVTMAMDDFLPAEAVERAKAKGGEAACLARRDSWYAEAFVWTPGEASDAGDGGDGRAVESGGMSDSGADAGGAADAGHADAFAQPGMPMSPPIIYVSISLRPEACDFGGSVLLDAGGIWAIDTVNWRILATRH